MSSHFAKIIKDTDIIYLQGLCTTCILECRGIIVAYVAPLCADALSEEGVWYGVKISLISPISRKFGEYLLWPDLSLVIL